MRKTSSNEKLKLWNKRLLAIKKQTLLSPASVNLYA